MTLAAHLAERIRAAGPLTMAEYMAECLLNPRFGYYTTRDPLGAEGDFTTAPEISQMFGELVGLCLAQSWLDQGAPTPFLLAELGPGRGTLMADILRATRQVPGFHAAAQLHLVEASPTLRARQSETIGARLTHHDSLAELPAAPLFLIANEFFDALPIRQFQRTETGWRERVVGLADGALTPGLADPSDPPALAPRKTDTQPGDIVELCPAANAIAAEIGARVAELGGMALIIDYGDWRSLGDTLQAVSNHQSCSPFAAPGSADLTAHVDFEALAAAAAPASHTRLTPQGVFLERLGITARANALSKSLGEDARVSHIAAHRRLTHPDEMGTLFKTMAMYKTDSPLPPGFAP